MEVIFLCAMLRVGQLICCSVDMSRPGAILETPPALQMSQDHKKPLRLASNLPRQSRKQFKMGRSGWIRHWQVMDPILVIKQDLA